MRYWDEFDIGHVEDLGHYTFTRESILRFAGRFDPQPFHLDEEAAARSVLGGLCASGWQTASIFMRLNVLHQQRVADERAAAGLVRPVFGPSPGVGELRWLLPVRAGETLHYTQTVIGKRISASRPDWGLISTRVEARNEAGALAFSMLGKVFVQVEEPPKAD
ncbi:MaoC family dehydratase [Aureimonas sp. AU12]|uniref:MaoC family dehydratase n=1 Tax=Aureimonas sp. AU12 TaxID=1638161 RepID=UPI000783DFA6|nr:MaoC family dehydratase [Aureimonas sp. AU12]